jgi:hypothetical protein
MKKLRKRDSELNQLLGTNCPQVGMLTNTGKTVQKQLTGVWTMMKLTKETKDD